jgi:hypothetical protein
MNFICPAPVQTLPDLRYPTAVVMRCKSVFRVGYFVQMVSAVRIKFTPSVAGALHPFGHIPNGNKTLGACGSASVADLTSL